MTGQVQLSSLRVSAEMDATGYKSGADAIEAANKRMADSGQAAGAALAQQDAAVGRSSGTLVSLSRQFVDGYTNNAKFTTQVGQLQTQMELGNASASRATQIYSGMVNRYGLLADATKIAAGGNKEFAAVIDQVNAKSTAQVQTFTGATQATGKLATGAGLARYELINLSRQFQDIGVSLASGQSPLLVAVQQGTQIADVFASSTGTVGGFFKQLVSGATSFFTPARLVLGGLVAIGAEAVYASASVSAAERDIERALIGVGRASGVTVADVNRVAATSASATRTSFADAQAGATQLLKTGAVYKETFTELNLVTDKFALATGTTTVEAAKKLGEVFADPVKGAQSLNKEYGFLNASTLQQIRNYQALGDEQSAQLTLIKAFEPTLDKLNEKTGLVSRAWTALWNAGSNVNSAVGSFLSSGSDEDQLARLKSQQQEMQGRSAPQVGSLGTLALPDPALLDAVNKKIAELEARIKAAAAESDAARLDKLGLQVEAITRAANPAIGQLENLEKAYAALQKAKAAGISKPEDDVTARAIQVQKALLVEASGNADSYNRRVIEIGASYQNVGVSTALLLQKMSGQLPVAKPASDQEDSEQEKHPGTDSAGKVIWLGRRNVGNRMASAA
ncbi:MAG: hypothetical protein QOD56_2868 [Gammaproteobacteria bacterium]|jgi:phage-related minor tail protein|nr:hypothetical protein [Gammaproteobacteria bacterium]